MKLTVLIDNSAIIDRYFLAEPGFSCLLEDDDTMLLFDAGYSAAFLDNAAAMGIDLGAIDAVVLSHGHDDHAGGLRHWLARGPAAGGGRRPALIAHPRAFDPKRLGDLAIGSPAGLPELSSRFQPRLSSVPLALGARFVFLGEIPRRNGCEAREPIGDTDGPTGTIPDYIVDDSAIVWKGDEGLVIVTGCSHSGIVNIAEYAIEVCGDDRVADIVGGFHLLEATDERLGFTAGRLKRLAPRAVHPGHCTDLAARIRLAADLPVRELGVGLELEYR
ncbi:MAG: MBL fold metallo-hydrolase [Spirochaetae bacterium HGW-Spirochaetae-3]|jgi:7,8-dihydropterin-6-yl-methyl-4-(beta-D-ribofuranosyl)aminobenzene 5'-phosphate synthase|nr:MAG: MBL fold metallo-hydrolase [Spirochaetae bacterium HGW-Spirochaetae-3]